MALMGLPGIPSSLQRAEQFGRGIDTGFNMFQRLIANKLARDTLEKAHELDPLRARHLRALAEQAEGNASESSMFNEMFKDRLSNYNLGGNPPSAVPNNQMALEDIVNSPFYRANDYNQSIFPMNPFQVQYDTQANQVPSSNAPNLTMPNQAMDLAAMAKSDPILRIGIKKRFGIDFGEETPQEKRQAEQENRRELESIKREEHIKTLGSKEKLALEKDLPILEDKRKDVDKLLEIAKNPANKNMFGHYILPELYAKTTTNKSFGPWQNLLTDIIAALEQKLSSRGNIVALKMSEARKPTHAEQQSTAVGKLESMREKLDRQIAISRKKLGKESEEPGSMDFTNMSDEELMRRARGSN